MQHVQHLPCFPWSRAPVVLPLDTPCASDLTSAYAAQVQDVGLIFLSAMATSIAGMSAAAGISAQEALGTTLVTLVIATFLVGSLIVLVGASPCGRPASRIDIATPC